MRCFLHTLPTARLWLPRLRIREPVALCRCDNWVRGRSQVAALAGVPGAVTKNLFIKVGVAVAH